MTPRTRDASIVLHVDGFELAVPVQIPEPEMRLAELAAIACALTQAIADHREAQSRRDGRPISCRTGCAACCRHLVPISAPEALRLGDAIDRQGAADRMALLARFERVAPELGRQRIDERLEQARDSADALRLVANQYFAQRIACPFLVDELCSIHALRPVACRSYGVTSPAAWCSEPAMQRVEPVPMPPHLSVPLARVAAQLTGEPAVPIALALLPSWLREHEELRARSWPSDALLARFLAQVGAWPEQPGDRGDGAALVVESRAECH